MEQFICINNKYLHHPTAFEIGKKYCVQIQGDVIYFDDEESLQTNKHRAICEYHEYFIEFFIPIIEHRKNKIEEILK